MLCGDFNMICNAADKNNSRLHRRTMSRFRQFLNNLELKELHLHGRLYTWSNERAHPTLERWSGRIVSLTITSGRFLRMLRIMFLYC